MSALTEKVVTIEALAALPVGSVCVDPYDAKGDAPVIICRRGGDRLWDAMGGEKAWTDAEVIRVTHGRLLVVYVPDAARIAEGKQP